MIRSFDPKSRRCFAETTPSRRQAVFFPRSTRRVRRATRSTTRCGCSVRRRIRTRCSRATPRSRDLVALWGAGRRRRGRAVARQTSARGSARARDGDSRRRGAPSVRRRTGSPRSGVARGRGNRRDLRRHVRLRGDAIASFETKTRRRSIGTRDCRDLRRRSRSATAWKRERERRTSASNDAINQPLCDASPRQCDGFCGRPRTRRTVPIRAEEILAGLFFVPLASDPCALTHSSNRRAARHSRASLIGHCRMPIRRSFR